MSAGLPRIDVLAGRSQSLNSALGRCRLDGLANIRPCICEHCAANFRTLTVALAGVPPLSITAVSAGPTVDTAASRRPSVRVLDDERVRVRVAGTCG